MRGACRKPEPAGVYRSLSINAELAASALEPVHDPVRHRRETEATLQGGFQGPVLRDGADRAGGLPYLRYPLSYRDIEELFLERGVEVDHSTLNRWVLACAPLIEQRLRQFRQPHCGSVHIDETYIKVRGEWRYLYRAIDKNGTSVDFLLTVRRDLDAAKRFFRKMLKVHPLLAPDRIGTDGASIYPSAIVAARSGCLLPRIPLHYVTKHLQQGIESDHFRVKKNMPRVGAFRSFNTARRTIQGISEIATCVDGPCGASGKWCRPVGVQSCVRPVDAALMTAGPDEVRDQGPYHAHAL